MTCAPGTAEPADVDAQLRMLEIALRNVRRLHRAVEWSQMMLAGPRGEGDPITAAAGAEILDRRPRVRDRAPRLRVQRRLMPSPPGHPGTS